MVVDEFVVEISEVLKRRVVVVADDVCGALDLVEGLYDCGRIVLSADDFVDVDFRIE